MEDGMVLDFRGDDVPAPGLRSIRDAADGQIVCFGASADENDLGGLGMDQARYLLPRVVQERLCLLPEPMNGRRVTEVFAEDGKHRGGNLGAHRSRGVTVEIDSFHYVLELSRNARSKSIKCFVR